MVDSGVSVVRVTPSSVVRGILMECCMAWTLEVIGSNPLGELRIIGWRDDWGIEVAVHDYGVISEPGLGDQFLYEFVDGL